MNRLLIALGVSLVVGLTAGFAWVTPERLAEIRAGDAAPQMDAASVFQNRILPYARANAQAWSTIDQALSDAGFSTACDEYGVQPSQAFPCAFWVRLTGTIQQIDRESRAGEMILRTESGDAVTILLGPVVTGYAVRDGFPEIGYSDFENQDQFADFGDALNQQAIASVADLDLSEGQTVEILGVFATWGGPGSDIQIVPVAAERP